ncbi:MAG: hypothetical protein GXX90_05460 [Microbacteriaceae bacterium]|nr:hypothetical protein [Microbacteriaceae bacterium]
MSHHPDRPAAQRPGRFPWDVALPLGGALLAFAAFGWVLVPVLDVFAAMALGSWTAPREASLPADPGTLWTLAGLGTGAGAAAVWRAQRCGPGAGAGLAFGAGVLGIGVGMLVGAGRWVELGPLADRQDASSSGLLELAPLLLPAVLIVLGALPLVVELANGARRRRRAEAAGPAAPAPAPIARATAEGRVEAFEFAKRWQGNNPEFRVAVAFDLPGGGAEWHDATRTVRATGRVLTPPMHGPAVGMPIRVHYDPADPSDVVLEFDEGLDFVFDTRYDS